MRKVISTVLFLFTACWLLSGCQKEAKITEGEYMRLADHVTEEMLTADAWVKPSQKVWLSPEEIEALNEENRKILHAGEEQISLEEFGEKVTAEDVLRDLSDLSKPLPEKEGYLDGEPVTRDYWLEHIQNANIDGVPAKLQVRYGYSVKRASLRALPCADFIGETETDLFYDEMVASEFLPAKPLIIVHESADHDWYFVYMDSFAGWIEKENIAICPSKEDWLLRQEPEDFLVVTGREIRLSTDRGSEELSGLLLPMGTVLPLVKTEDAPESIGGRYNYGNYIVTLPVRSENGKIADAYAMIPVTADVSHGYLSYNGETVIELAMKRLGDRYGWAGLDNSQDCSGMLREIFSCFGIYLPRYSGDQANLAGTERYDLSETDEKNKISLLKKLPAGSVLYFPGHIMLYLGMKEGRPYVISAVGSFAPEGMETGTAQSINTVVINDLYIRRRNGKSWLESLTVAEVIR